MVDVSVSLLDTTSSGETAELVAVLEASVTRLSQHHAVVLDLLDRLRHRASADRPVESLTDRELEVLRRLPTLMSNREIAADVHLSVNTVKTHLKAVYRKLGVEGRRQAIVRGRELELIS